jgi:hypothetical protein
MQPVLDLLFWGGAEQYIKSGEGLSSIRHIFHKFPFDQFEEANLDKIKSFISKNNIAIPTNWREPELLRVLYSARFDIPAAARLIHNHVIWLNNKKLHLMTPTKINLIVRASPLSKWQLAGIPHLAGKQNKKFFYCLGRDNQFRPIIHVDLAKWVSISKVSF